MARRHRMMLFLVAGGCLAVLLAMAFLAMPAFGQKSHFYRDHAVAASVQHVTANVVESLTFDQRGLDTLGEEVILLASVVGAAALLRPAKEETEERETRPGRVLEGTRLTGYLMLAVTMLIGMDVVIHGHLTPGGGFQGGVVLATGIHLVYLAGNYPALERLRPQHVFEVGEAVGAAAFAILGLAAMIVAGAFLANVIPQSDFSAFGHLLSAGTVPLLNIIVGLEVGSSMIVLLTAFFKQAMAIRGSGSPRGTSSGGSDR